MRSPWHHDPRIRISEQQIAKLFLERNACCRECGANLDTRSDWIVEHIIALENGGSNEWDNLGITGRCCKASKDAADHGKAAKSRSTAARHFISKSMRKPSKFRRVGFQWNWSTGRYEKTEG